MAVDTADHLPQSRFECIIFGFCLYFCDRSDLFRIAAEAARVVPYRNPYSHQPGLFSYKMDYAALWRWRPAYCVWRHEVTAEPSEDPTDPDRRLAVTALRKC